MSIPPRRGRQTHSSYSGSSESLFAIWFQDPRIRLGSIVLILILVIFGIAKTFFRDNIADRTRIFQTSLVSSGTAYALSSDQARVLKASDVLYMGDTGTKTQQAQLEVSSTGQAITLDKNTEVKIDSQAQFEILAGSVFGVISSEEKITTKFATLSATQDAEVLVIQNPVASTFATISGKVVHITTQNAVVTLPPGKMITLFAQDTLKMDISEKVLPISDTVTSHPLFILKNGAKKIAEMVSNSTNTGSGVTLSASGVNIEDPLVSTGVLTVQTGAQLSLGERYIEITSPKDGSQTTKSLITVTGKVLRDEVTKVLINEKSALVKSDKTFSLSDINLTQRNNTILYKALGANNKVLDSGYLIIINPQLASTPAMTAKEIPIADKKLYYISSPSSNPYQTTDKTVKIIGVVPKGKVRAVEVNGFRLKKYISYSTSWTYTATAEGQYPNLKPDLNLYKVVYYGQNDEILGSTLYSVFLETTDTTISGSTN